MLASESVSKTKRFFPASNCGSRLPRQRSRLVYPLVHRQLRTVRKGPSHTSLPNPPSTKARIRSLVKQRRPRLHKHRHQLFHPSYLSAPWALQAIALTKTTEQIFTFALVRSRLFLRISHGDIRPDYLLSSRRAS